MHFLFDVSMYRLDAALLIVLAVSVALLVHRWAVRTHGLRGVSPTAWLLLAACLTIGIGLAEYLTTQTRLQLQGMLEGFAATYGAELERFGHARVSNNASPDDSLYLSLIDVQKRWLTVNASVNDIYTFRKLPDGRVILLVDSETDYDRNGRIEGEREERTPIGESYPTDSILERAFAGSPMFDGHPAVDRWGIWVSAYVPLYDTTGQVEAVLGVDYDADNWIRAIERSRAVGIGFGALLSAILIGIVAFMTATRAELAHRILTERSLRESEAALSQARDVAVESARHKTEFLANMSHEIRTPMNGVMGVLGLLLDSKLDQDQREQVTMAYQSAEQLLTILNDILDLSKIESGKLRIEQAPFDLAATTKEVTGLPLLAAREKGIRLHASYDPNAPRWVVGDSGRIRQVLMNIVGNAIKFTQHGEVTLRVDCPARDGDTATISLAVADTGIGIPGEKLVIIFDKFSQADASTTRRFGGTGLGLAISQQLVELMGGSIAVTSVVGQGSTFTITLRLPIAAAPPAAVSAVTAASAPSWTGTNGVQVLVADDNVINQRIAMRMLERLGCQVDVAANGLEAVAMVQQKCYSLVFLDVQMPEMDGTQACAAIRALSGPVNRTPLIAMTAHALAGDRERFLTAGMDDYIAKPVSKAELERVLGKFVS